MSKLYKVWLQPEVYAKRKNLPAHIRSQIKTIIDNLAQEPRPAKSKKLQLPDEWQSLWEVRRLRLDNWRVIYAVNETWLEIGILAIEKRPPYNYNDLAELLATLD